MEQEQVQSHGMEIEWAQTMPRTQLYRTDKWAYHVTNRSNNREWFYLPQQDCWKIFRSALSRSVEKYGAHIHALVLMSNHFHLILTTPNSNVDVFMRHFSSLATYAIQRRAHRINHVFGGRYSWSVLDSAYALAYVYKYVLRNPVRAGVCSHVDAFPYSTLKHDGNDLPIVGGITPYWQFIPRSYSDRVAWLNHPVPAEAEHLITRAVKHPRFRFSKDSNLQDALRSLRQNYRVESPLG